MKAEFAKVNAGVLPWQERSARFLDLALSLRIGRGRPCGNPHLYSVQTRIAENRRIGVPLNSSCLACERRRAVDEAKVVLLIQGGKEPVEVKHTCRWRVDRSRRQSRAGAHPGAGVKMKKAADRKSRWKSRCGRNGPTGAAGCERQGLSPRAARRARCYGRSRAREEHGSRRGKPSVQPGPVYEKMREVLASPGG